MPTISSNHFSVDQQIMDAILWLADHKPNHLKLIFHEFPEEPIMNGAHFDTEAMGVDPEWGNWLLEAIEDTGFIFWEDGEPWAAARYLVNIQFETVAASEQEALVHVYETLEEGINNDYDIQGIVEVKELDL